MGTLAVETALNASPVEVGPQLVSLPEDQWLERKSSRLAPQDLAKALIGFANADGGAVIVGLADGEIEGTRGSLERRNAQIQANIDFCVPPVRAKHRLIDCIDSGEEPNELVAIELEPSDSVHAKQKDEVFLRGGEGNRRLGSGG